MPPQYTIPPSTRAVGTGNPPADMNGVADALTAMGAAGNVLNAAYAGGADPTGAADSTTAIQAAINAAAYISASDASGILGAAQATVYLPGGTYLISSGPLVLPHGHSLRITGAGDGTILKSTANAIIDFDGLNGLTEGSVEIDHLGFDAAGGHVFQNPNLHGLLHLHDLAIRQRSTGFSVFWADDTVTGASTGLYQAIFRNIRYILDAGTRSVEAWHIVSNHSDGFTDLTWEHISGPVPTGYTGNDATLDNTQYQWWVTSALNTSSHVSNLTWRDCIMSSPFGGIIKVAAAQSVLIENVSSYNTFDRAMSNSLYQLTSDPTGNGPVQGAVIRNCFRTNALGSGSTQPPYDVLLDSTCKNVLIENIVTGYSPAVTFINAGGASGVVVIQPGGGGAASVPVISNPAADTVVISQGQVTVGGVPSLQSPGAPANGLAAWSHDIATAGTSGTIAIGGTLYLIAFTLLAPAPLTKIWWVNTTAAVTPTSGQSQVGVYNPAGTLVASATATATATAMTGTNAISVSLSSSYPAAPGTYWVGMVFQAATEPTILRGPTNNGNFYNLNRSAATLRACVNGTGITTALPSSITPSSNTTTGSIVYWVGVS